MILKVFFNTIRIA